MTFKTTLNSDDLGADFRKEFLSSAHQRTKCSIL